MFSDILGTEVLSTGGSPMSFGSELRICTQEQIKQIDAVLDRYYGRETAATNELKRQQDESQEQEDNEEIER